MKIRTANTTYNAEVEYIVGATPPYAVDDGLRMGRGNTIEEAVDDFLGFIRKHQRKWRMPEQIREQVDSELVDKIECMELPTLPTCYLSYEPQTLELRWGNGARLVFFDNYDYAHYGFNQVDDSEWKRKTLSALYD